MKKDEIKPNEIMRFSGTSLDDSFSGTTDVIVIDPYYNKNMVSKTVGKKDYDKNGRLIIRTVLVEKPAHKDRPTKRFIVNWHNLQKKPHFI